MKKTKHLLCEDCLRTRFQTGGWAIGTTIEITSYAFCENNTVYQTNDLIHLPSRGTEIAPEVLKGKTTLRSVDV